MSKTDLIAYPLEPFDPATDYILFWLLRSQLSLITSKVEKTNQLLFLLHSLPSNAYRSLSAFVWPYGVTRLTLQALIEPLKKI